MITLRLYRSSDCPALIDLFRQTIHTINAQHYTPEQLKAWAPEIIDTHKWDQSLSTHHTLIAEINGKIAGFSDMDNLGYLDRLYIHKDHQRQGIARQLVAALEEYARSKDIPLITTAASITARPFFEKQGYQVLKEQQVCCNSQTFLNYLMEKRLQ